jgi:hypothetical protein
MEAVDYRIRVKGHLPPEWSEWFEGMRILHQPDGTTILSGPIRDQAALHGQLMRVRDLGLSLISVNPAAFNQDESHGTGELGRRPIANGSA